MSNDARGQEEGDLRHLDRWLARSKDSRVLAEIVQKYGKRFNEIHVTAAWVGLAKMPMPMANGGRLPAFHLVLVKRLQGFTKSMPAIHSDGIMHVLHSMGKLHAAGGMFEVDRELVRGLMSQAATNEGGWEVLSVANLLFGLARMGVRPGADLLATMESRAAEGGAMPHEIGELLTLATTGATPEADRVEATQRWAAGAAGDLSHQEVAALLWALAKLGVRPHADMVAALGGRETACDSKDITKLLSGCSDPHRLLGLLQDYGAKCNAINLSAAWNNLAKM
ncbi:hypothetical protein T484DRAFT_1836023, partial [Baffinella frigidus]